MRPLADSVPEEIDEHPGMPAWVKVFLAFGLAVVVLGVTLLVAGDGHGPGRHVPFVPETGPTGSGVGSAGPEIDLFVPAGPQSTGVPLSR